MLLELRPAPSPSAIAYVEFCRCHLADVVADPGDLASTLTPDVVDLFTGLLDRWQRIAEAGPVFAQGKEINVKSLDREVELRRPFRVALVNGILIVLEREGQGSATLAAEPRAQWPDDDIA